MWMRKVCSVLGSLTVVLAACEGDGTAPREDAGAAGDGADMGDGADTGDGSDVDEDAGVDAGEGDASVPAAELEIAGRWHSSFGGTETIDSASWSGYGTQTVIQYDNDDNVLVAQNPADDAFNPSKFSRVVWTEPGTSGFYYCVVDFGLDTAQAALDSTMVADASDPDNSGCGGFSWTKLGPVIAAEGNWTDGTMPLTIDSDHWGMQTVVSYDNTASSAILQNPEAVPGALTFSKVVWVLGDASLVLCVASSGAATAELAETSAVAVDKVDFDTGCGGAAWSRLDAAP